MPGPERPNQNTDEEKGERWSSEDDSVSKVDYDVPAEHYPPDDGDNAGDATNRPIDEEADA